MVLQRHVGDECTRGRSATGIRARCSRIGVGLVAGVVSLLSLMHGASGRASVDLALREQEVRPRTVTRDPATGRWVEVAPPARDTPEGDLNHIRALLAERAYRKALREARGWCRRYGESHPELPAALLLESQSLIALRRFDEAHEKLTVFLNEYDGTRHVHEALRQEFIVAEAYLGGARRRFLWIRMLPGDDVALQILDNLSVDFPGDKHAELAIKTKADYFLRTGDNELAEMEYVRLLNDHPHSRYHAYALRRAADSAQASYNGPEYDEAPLIEAQNRFEEYALHYPDQAAGEGVGGILARIREDRAAKVLVTGRYYERSRHPRTAVYYYQLVVRDWHGTGAERDARVRLAALGVEPGSAPSTQPAPPETPVDEPGSAGP